MASAARRPEGFLRSNRREGAQTGRVHLLQQTRARRALLDWLRRLACRNSSVLRSLRGGNERNITKSLADGFWADDAPLGESDSHGGSAPIGLRTKTRHHDWSQVPSGRLRSEYAPLGESLMMFSGRIRAALGEQP